MKEKRNREDEDEEEEGWKDPSGIHIHSIDNGDMAKRGKKKEREREKK